MGAVHSTQQSASPHAIQPTCCRGFCAKTWPSTFVLLRPLLRAMAACMWEEGSQATPHELNLTAARTLPFMSTPAADLARSILDAGVLGAGKTGAGRSNAGQRLSLAASHACVPGLGLPVDL